MHDSGTSDSTDSAQVGTVVEQGIHECPCAVPGCRMNDQEGRFVDHEEVVVLIYDVKGNRLGRRLRGLRW
jgi:hypothetical protein